MTLRVYYPDIKSETEGATDVGYKDTASLCMGNKQLKLIEIFPWK